jgi:hypothetical protein
VLIFYIHYVRICQFKDSYNLFATIRDCIRLVIGLKNVNMMELKNMNAGPLFRDPDIDMKRAMDQREWVRMLRMIAATLRRFAPGFYVIETPRRSVDRELEQFSSRSE